MTPSTPFVGAPVGDADTARTMDALRRMVRALGTSARGPNRGAVTGARLFVLRQIAGAPGLSLGQLAARTFAGQSSVSEVVAHLVDAGLVTRAASATDARQAVLTVTAAGRRTASRAEPMAQERLAEGLAALSIAERATLARALEGWLVASGLADTPAAMFFEEPAPAGDA